MDDETYVKMDFGQLPGQKFYLAKLKGGAPVKFKFVFQDKFARKSMIWQGIYSCGKNKAFHHGSVHECITLQGGVFPKEGFAFHSITQQSREVLA